MSGVNQDLPDWHYQQAQILMDEIITHKDEPSFMEPAAMLLLTAANVHTQMGLLAAKILDQRP